VNVCVRSAIRSFGELSNVWLDAENLVLRTRGTRVVQWNA
jgi:hypothetical protein